jgi:hypothetical protein
VPAVNYSTVVECMGHSEVHTEYGVAGIEVQRWGPHKAEEDFDTRLDTQNVNVHFAVDIDHMVAAGTPGGHIADQEARGRTLVEAAGCNYMMFQTDHTVGFVGAGKDLAGVADDFELAGQAQDIAGKALTQ